MKSDVVVATGSSLFSWVIAGIGLKIGWGIVGWIVDVLAKAVGR